MTTFAYKARNVSGQSVSGQMEAVSKSEILEKLRRLGYLPTEVTEPFPTFHVGSLLNQLQWLKQEDLAMFNIQLSNLLQAGVPLLSSLQTMSSQIENRMLRSTVDSVAKFVETGESFSEALAHHPKIFPTLFVTLVRAGEASGKLDQILARYADYCEQQSEFHQKIQGAMIYPFVLLASSVAVTLFVVTALLPQFVQIFLKAGVSLPLPTLILYRFGLGLKQFWFSILLFTALGAGGFQYYAATSFGGLQVDRLKLFIPVFGSILRRAAISRFARTLGLLVASGVPLLQSLEIVRDVVENEVLARTLDTVRNAIEKGGKISESLRISGEFPADTIRMISVGEEAGSLDVMLGKTADFYDRSLNYQVKQLTVLLEPALLIIMGGLVGMIMASILLPLFDMLKVIK